MSFAGRNWAKIGKKLLQDGVTPLANQLVDPHRQPAWARSPTSGPTVNGPVEPRRQAGPAISYPELIRLAFKPQLLAQRRRTT